MAQFLFLAQIGHLDLGLIKKGQQFCLTNINRSTADFVHFICRTGQNIVFLSSTKIYHLGICGLANYIEEV